MADGSSGSSALLGVIIGAALVIGLGVWAFGGFGGGKTTIVDVKPPAITSSK